MGKKTFKKIGGLWDNKGYMSGVIELPSIGKIRISIIKDQYRQPGSSQPEFIISEIIDEDASKPATNDGDKDDEIMTTFKGDDLDY